MVHSELSLLVFSQMVQAQNGKVFLLAVDSMASVFSLSV